MVIITADHGEGLGQHKAPGHGGLLWKEQLHVPLIMRIPGTQPKREATTWSINIFPLLLQLLELPNEDLFLKQASEPTGTSTNKHVAVFSEVGEGHRSVTTKRWKYIAWNDDSHSLFELDQDPYELNDIAGTNPKQANLFHKHLSNRLETFQERATEFGSGETQPMSQEQVDLLRALGYVEEDPERETEIVPEELIQLQETKTISQQSR